eukprot:2542231-Pyramimonas_sp.AAC.1
MSRWRHWLMWVVESVGRLPQLAPVALLALLGKASGGFRPIGVFVSWCRLRGTARAPPALKLEFDSPRAYWATGAHRGAADVVWRQAVNAESG